MNDLVAFLRARLDTDEANAQWWIAEAPHQGPQVLAAQTGFDGERMLREVAAGRAIVAEYVAVRKLQGLTDTPEDGYRDWVLRQLAAVYSDHPDYRQEWKP